MHLFQALYLLTGDASEADDVTQEALLRAYERWDRVGSMDSPAGYVYRTALNLYRSRLRRLAVRARRVFAAIPSDDVSGSVAAAQDVQAALAAIPEGQREALILVEWLGLGLRRPVACWVSTLHRSEEGSIAGVPRCPAVGRHR